MEYSINGGGWIALADGQPSPRRAVYQIHITNLTKPSVATSTDRKTTS